MEGDLENFRGKALRLIGRLVEIEERLQAEAEERGDDALGVCHEHGAMCLREAANVLRTADGV